MQALRLRTLVLLRATLLLLHRHRLLLLRTLPLLLRTLVRLRLPQLRAQASKLSDRVRLWAKVTPEDHSGLLVW
jgi:hypothetical protein